MDERSHRLGDQSELLQAEPSDVASGGVILWRMVTDRQNIWCLVFEHSDAFFVVVDDDPEGTDAYRVCEQFADIVGALDRSEAMRKGFLGMGWLEVDVE